MSSYVTRRLLRSTFPDTTNVAEVEEKPPRRSKLRTKRDEKHKVARHGKAEEQEEHDENEQAGGNDDDEPEAAPEAEGHEDAAAGGETAADASALHGFELLIDVNYAKDLWAEARVLDIDVSKQEVFVHYMGWNARYDAWVAPKLAAAHGSRTKCATKKKMSWDGKRSLFAPVEGSTPRKKEPAGKQQRSPCQSATLKFRSGKRKRKGSTGSGSTSASAPEPTPQHDQQHPLEDATVKDGAVVDSATRVTRARVGKANRSSNERDVEVDAVSPTNMDDCVKEERNSGVACKEEEMPLADATPSGDVANGTGPTLRRRAGGKRRGRGRKGQEDESSESEYSAHEDSDVEEEDDASDEEEVQRLRKRRNQTEQGLMNDDDEEVSDAPSKSKRPATRRSERRTTNAKTHPLPQSALRKPLVSSGDGGATRERLAAIFRQRVYQQQLMQVTRAEMQAQQPSSGTAAAPVVPAPTDPPAGRTRPRRSANRNGSKASAAPVSAPVAVPDPQLVAYYHYHNMMMAQAYMTADPKEIQERLRAIEEQRALQVQAYYRQLEAVRAQNVQSIDDAQEFMAKSASAWQQQSGAVQSGSEYTANGDSTGLKDWTDMTKSLENGKSAAANGDSPRDATARELVDINGVTQTDEDKAAAGPDQSDDALKHETKTQSSEPEAPRDDILYEFVL